MNSQKLPTLAQKSSSFQIGTLGFWFNYELPLNNSITFRTEIGVYTDITKGVGYFIAPEINLEPRWYYNIKKRSDDDKDISNNSANFFTVVTKYRSKIFEISNLDSDRAENAIAFIPKWGIKRNLSTKFNYEIGLGLGYLSYINRQNVTLSGSDGLFIDVHFRIGYSF